MSMQTQKATSTYDLPHALQSAASGRCVCGREADDGMHDTTPVAERAAHEQPLRTEHGS